MWRRSVLAFWRVPRIRRVREIGSYVALLLDPWVV
jgi:hypothetical protein